MSDNNSSITVFAADDHSLILDALKVRLATLKMNLVGTTTSLDDIISSYDELKPDVVLLDIRFGNDDKSSLEIAETLIKQRKANIIFFSQYDQASLVKRVYEIGAKAFLSKGVEGNELKQAITNASSGQHYFNSNNAKMLAQASLDSGDPQKILTEDEFKVFIYVAQGNDYGEILNEIDIAKRTLTKRIASIRTKLDISRNAHLTMLALQFGYIENIFSDETTK